MVNRAKAVFAGAQQLVRIGGIECVKQVLEVPLVVAAHRLDHLHHRRRRQRRLSEINLAALARLACACGERMSRGRMGGGGSHTSKKSGG